MKSPTDLQQISMIALHQSEWSDLFSIGEVRISAGRVIGISQNLGPDFKRIFAHSANRKLEDSAQMVVVSMNTGLNSLQKHPLSSKGDLVVISENDVSRVQVVSQKDLFYIRETIEPYGFSIPDETLDVEWESWYVFEGIRRNTSLAIALCEKLGLTTNWKKRSDNLTWNQITSALTRFNTATSFDDLVLKVASNAKHLLSEVRTQQNTDALPIAISSAWIHLLEPGQPFGIKPKLQSKVESILIDARNRRIDGSEPFTPEILELSKKLKNSFKPYFSREITPLSLAFIFRFIYLNEISNFSKESFFIRLNQVQNLDGQNAARLAAYVVASRMGAEKVHEVFFARSAILPSDSQNLNMQSDSEPRPELETVVQDIDGLPASGTQQLEN
jgi:hypothetical protein